MKKNVERINIRRKLFIGILIIFIGVVVSYLFYNTGIVQMVLDLFSPYPEV